jgi:hypothetical protein
MSGTTRGTAWLAAAGGFAAFALLTVTAVPADASGGKPTITKGASVETFDDDLILDLCGITTTTTLTQHFVVKDFPDGSRQVHVTRTYHSADPRLPIEKGAGTTFFSPTGVRRVTGTPIHLIGPTGGTRLLDAGQVTFADELQIHGPHPSRSAPSLAPYYCPA